jgi:hypothetical protein
MIWHNTIIFCPICGKRGEGRQSGGCIPEGQDSDLFVRTQGSVHVIQSEIHMCLDCFYAGTTDDFDIKVSESKKAEFQESLTPKFKRRMPDGKIVYPHEGYLLAYMSASFLGRDHDVLINRLLRAYWCLRMAPCSQLGYKRITKLKGIYLSQILPLLKQLLKIEFDPRYCYLAAELSRRAEEFEQSKIYFRKFIEYRGQCAEYLKKAATPLYLAAKRCDSAHYSMEVILYGCTEKDK